MVFQARMSGISMGFRTALFSVPGESPGNKAVYKNKRIKNIDAILHLVMF
jgi:hypothetical protein